MRPPVDDLMDQLGNPGKYQMMVFCFLGFSYVHVGINCLIIVIYGSKVPFHCNTTYDPERVFNQMINVSDQLEQTCIISEEGPTNALTNHTQPCETRWLYHTTEKSPVSEWDLVCEREYLVALSSTIFFAGLMFGGFVFGFLADHFGRKPVILSTLYGNILVGVGIYFSPNYIIFVVLRFAQGVLVEGLHSSTFTYTMEVFHSRHHTTAGGGLQLFWAVGVMLLAGIWYLIQDWRYIQLAITLPFVVTISYIWVLPESLRWLLAREKYKAAEVMVRRLVKCNGLPYPRETMELLQSDGKMDKVAKTAKYTVLDLIRTPLIRRRSVILFFMWFSHCFAYFGLSLAITDLAGNKFLNFFINGSVEIPAYIMAIFVLKRLGRRLPTSILYLLCGVSCIVSGIVYSEDPVRQQIALALAMFGKCCAASLYVVFVFTSELFPTVIRNIGFGTCTVFYNIGGMAAPQVISLGTITFQQLPVVVFGGSAFVAGAITLFLPDTANKSIPDNIEDVENPSTPVEERREQTNQI